MKSSLENVEEIACYIGGDLDPYRTLERISETPDVGGFFIVTKNTSGHVNYYSNMEDENKILRWLEDFKFGILSGEIHL